ncbi:hypothetical protein FE257_000198 [Aspergillus nanangensis]|uniref:P68 RBP/TagC-like beta-propeller domain-containing protein n=1 Tax=Aspergillus nanangensis TaxID=2582783 RepID=A0AAD4CZ33_ASPNN|nr:hypothetical protein FE257_000198 [Aspergillus nanangensis]
MRITSLLSVLGLIASAVAQLPETPRFDLTQPSYDLFRSKKLGGVTVQQSFTFDNVNRRLFVAQRRDGSDTKAGDLTISQLDFSGNLLGSMDLLGCGHGVNIAAQAVGDATYLWTETDTASSGYGQRLWRFEFVDGLTLDSAKDTDIERILPVADADRCTCTIDPVSNNLVVRYQRDSKQNIAVFDLDEATAGNFSTPLADFLIPDLNDLSNVFQGYTAYGNYIYFLLGESYDASSGVLNSQVVSLDLNTGKIAQGPVMTRAGSTLEFREPEGMAIYKTVAGEVRLFLGFASGKAGDRRCNLFYKNALVF